MKIAEPLLESGSTAGVPLRRLIADLDSCEVHGEKDVLISMVTSDSRKVGIDCLFVAVRGELADGHDYIRDAIVQGSRVLVVEAGRDLPPESSAATVVTVQDTREALGKIASAFYGHPSRQLRLIGITGTNGKTTTTYLVETIFRNNGFKTGVIGTVNYRYADKVYDAPFTTPDPVHLHGLFRRMLDSGVTHAIMEVSSHALTQKRLVGVDFDMALFTNLSRDHLDYHGNMGRYFDAKKALFLEHLKKDGQAVVLLDAERAKVETDWGGELYEILLTRFSGGEKQVAGCGIGQGLPYVERFSQSLQGIRMEIVSMAGKFTVASPLVGKFNVLNLLGASSLALAAGIAPEVISMALSTEQGAPGRLQRVPVGHDFDVFVDYAHTPDALENVLSTLRALGPRRIILVFGCGGDRDPGKRAIMGEIAGKLADVTMITTDNPRSENPERILDEVETGISGAGAYRVRMEIALKAGMRNCYDRAVLRRDAIRTAIRGACPGDVVLLCGKGHETYQILGKRRIFFDDAMEAQVAMYT